MGLSYITEKCLLVALVLRVLCWKCANSPFKQDVCKPRQGRYINLYLFLSWPVDQIVMIFCFRQRLVTRWTMWPSTKRLWSKVHWSIGRSGVFFGEGSWTHEPWWVMMDHLVKALSWTHGSLAALHDMLVASESWKTTGWFFEMYGYTLWLITNQKAHRNIP